MLDQASIRNLLELVSRREKSVEEAMHSLGNLPFEDIGYAKVDHHRAVRCGFPEVIYCGGKSPQQVAGIAAKLADKSPRLLGTRATPEHFAAASALVPNLQYDEAARAIWRDTEPNSPRSPGVVIVCAGTSDVPVAEETFRTLDMMGHSAHRIYDVGVAGLHRLLPNVDALRSANVVIVIAGMEGALPSVVGGLVSAPVIAVPTSVGYGASFGGVAALLGMLNSCASGLAVMNIDNGFGAANLAAKINSRIVAAEEKAKR